MAESTETSFTSDEMAACLRVLQVVSEDPSLVDNDERFKALVAKIHRLGKKGERRASQAERVLGDQQLLAETAMVRKEQDNRPTALIAPGVDSSSPGSLNRPQNCYICKAPYVALHFFYHRLCPDCAALNYAKREQRADLTGRVALLTGGRIKIGYQLALRMLRDGARVLVTTRFPADAARRFATEPDFADWQDRLVLHGLDLRHLPSVEAFADNLLVTETHLDILVNNAAQTIKRPREFYATLLAEEGIPALLESHPQYPCVTDVAIATYFPTGMQDADGQQIDTRPVNSWRLRLGEVETVEALETYLVGAVAPFILNGRLKPLLARSPFPRRFIINVSAMEGQFAREAKTEFHPHTNMAKAALNMMTRTSGRDYARDGIYMNSVDTGWITDENPFDRKEWLREERSFYTPLDAIDAMARLYDPIATGINDSETEPIYGQFLKDYAPYPW